MSGDAFHASADDAEISNANFVRRVVDEMAPT